MEHSRYISSKNSLFLFLLLSIGLHGILFMAVTDVGIRVEPVESSEPQKVLLHLLRTEGTTGNAAGGEEPSDTEAERQDTESAASTTQVPPMDIPPAPVTGKKESEDTTSSIRESIEQEKVQSTASEDIPAEASKLTESRTQISDTEIPSEQAPVEEVISAETRPEEVPGEQAAPPEEAISAETRPEEVPEQQAAPPEEVISEETSPEEMLDEQVAPVEEAVSTQTRPEELPEEQIAPTEEAEDEVASAEDAQVEDTPVEDIKTDVDPVEAREKVINEKSPPEEVPETERTVPKDAPAPSRPSTTAEHTKPMPILGKITTVTAAINDDGEFRLTGNRRDSSTSEGGGGSESIVPFDSLTEGATIPKPAYPQLARRWGHEGVAVVRIVVNSDGSIKDAELLRSSGHQELDEAALFVIRKRWRFKAPGREITTVKEFEFRLRR